jgi:hypothetical protein
MLSSSISKLSSGAYIYQKHIWVKWLFIEISTPLIIKWKKHLAFKNEKINFLFGNVQTKFFFVGIWQKKESIKNLTNKIESKKMSVLSFYYEL